MTTFQFALQMLSPEGDPSMDTLAAIFDAVRKSLKLSN
jgi:DNA-binding phage protein